MKIKSIEQHAYSYGPLEAHQLHVYHPPTNPPNHPNTKPPILIFIHGGGLTKGCLSHPPPHLIHANLGAYFATRGILTVITTYRLLPHITFPGGSEDIRDAILWVTLNLANKGDAYNIFLLGHSAGGVHLAGVLLLPSLFMHQIKESVKGVIFLGVPFEVGGGKDSDAGEYRKSAEEYYGGATRVGKCQPVGMLRKLGKEYVGGLPRMRNVVAEREPRRISSSAKRFTEMVKRRVGGDGGNTGLEGDLGEGSKLEEGTVGGIIEDVVLGGHNHMSPILALSTGCEKFEKWGEDVVEWVCKLSGAADKENENPQ